MENTQLANTELAGNLGGAQFTVGSPEHRRGLARFFLDTHIDYEPEEIRWRSLGETERVRLVGLPFWQEAVSTESRTSGKVIAAAQLESDVELRKAIELQGFEENRHARLLARAHHPLPHPDSNTPAPPAAGNGPPADCRLQLRMICICIGAAIA
jgi:hypothetical protein